MASRFYSEQEPQLYDDQVSNFYYDPNTGEFVDGNAAAYPVSAATPVSATNIVSGIGAPAATTAAAYSPETLAAYNEQQQYLADFVARTGYESELDKQYQSVARRATTDDYASSSGGDRMAEMYENPTIALSEDVLAERLRNAPPVEQRITSYFTPQTNDQESAGRLSAKYNTPFRLYDGNKLVYEGVGPEAAAEAAALATAISKEKGAEANWQVMQQSGDKWITTANDAPDFSVMDAALKYGLPLAVSFIPGLNVLATMAAAGAASTAGNLLAGESLKTSLISGALSAATAGVFKGLAPGVPAGPQLSDTFNAARGIGGALQDVLSTSGLQALGSAAGQSAAQAASQALTEAVRTAAGEIVVTASRGALPGLLSGTASALTGAGLADLGKSLLAPTPEPLSPQLETPELQTPELQTPQAAQAVPSNEMAGITVTGSTGSALPSSTLLSGITAPALQAAADQVIAERQAAEQRPAEEEMVVTGSRVPEFTLTPPIPAPTPDLRGITQALPVIEAPPVEPPPTADEEIVVTGSTGSAFPSSTLISGITAPALAEVAKLIAAEQQAVESRAGEEPTITVPANVLVDTASTIGGGLGAVGGTLLSDTLSAFNPPDPASAVDPDEIVVTAKKTPPIELAAIPLTALAGFTGAEALNAPGEPPGEPSKKTSVSDAIKIADLAATGIGAVADAVGGEGGGAGGVLDRGTGYIVPRYTRTRSGLGDDPFSYGQRSGELLFFDEGAEPAMAEGGEVDDDMVSHLIAYRKGGGHAGPGPVKGIGSGQEDKIPAWLSDGEYVWSAQDVADLGDGSTDEGVRRLDRMRQMVRRGAGRKDVKKIAKPQRGIQDMLKAVGGAV